MSSAPESSTEPDASPSRQGIAATFAHVANRTANIAGNYKTFVIMVAIVLIWAVSGPIFGFSTTWQLIINTGTTIVTFLMVFLIQNTQNRDSMAVHLKLDEIIRAIDEADDDLMRAEDETDQELAELKQRYQDISFEQRNLKSKIAERIDAIDTGP